MKRFLLTAAVLAVSSAAQASIISIGPDYNKSGGRFPVTAYSTVAEKNTGPETRSPTFNTGYDDVPIPIPEPATWALMLLGAGLSGAALRSRKRQALSTRAKGAPT